MPECVEFVSLEQGALASHNIMLAAITEYVYATTHERV